MRFPPVMAIIAISEGERTTLFPEPVGLWVACLRKECTSGRILRSCAAFHFGFATRNIAMRLEFGKIRGGIRRLTDTSTLPLFCQSQFGGEGGSVLICDVAPGFSPACAALKGGATFKLGHYQLNGSRRSSMIREIPALRGQK